MNINAYKEYRFSHGILTAPKTGNTYQFRISQNDRFYNYMKEHIANEVSLSRTTTISLVERSGTLFSSSAIR